MNSTADIEYNIKAFAMSNQGKFRGYEANFSYSPESDVANAQVTVAEVGGATKWQMCIGASAQGATAKVGRNHARGVVERLYSNQSIHPSSSQTLHTVVTANHIHRGQSGSLQCRESY